MLVPTENVAEHEAKTAQRNIELKLMVYLLSGAKRTEKSKLHFFTLQRDGHTKFESRKNDLTLSFLLM